MEIQKKIERIEKESLENYRELLRKKDGFTTKDIFESFSFKYPKGIKAYNCYPESISIKSLLPLYTTVLQRIYTFAPYYNNHILRGCDDFKRIYGFSPDEIAILSEKKKIIPIFSNYISQYPVEIVESIIESEVYLTWPQLDGLYLGKLNELGIYAEPFADDFIEPFVCDSDIVHFFGTAMELDVCKSGIKRASHIKPVKELLEVFLIVLDKCLVKNIANMRPSIPRSSAVSTWAKFAKVSGTFITANNATTIVEASTLESILQQPNYYLSDIAIELLGRLPDITTLLRAKDTELRPIDEICNLEYIVKKLGIAYSEGMNLNDYLEILNNRRTKSVRKIVNNIVSEYDKRKEEGIQLSRIIDEYNEKIIEICTSKRLKYVYSFSNLISQNLESICGILFGAGFLSLTGSPYGFLAPIAEKLSGFEIPKEEKDAINEFLKENVSKLFTRPDIIQLHEIREEIKKT